ncbi:MAG: UPF0280 family protein [Candidatus Omnitrophica bacterium]|nr:UPF0280 family protein [Candidatus Omnitrophota bacterium]
MERKYRNWVEDKGLISFQVKIKDSDLFIRADCDLKQQAQECLKYQRSLLEGYIQRDAEFATTLTPHNIKEKAPDIVWEMAEAAASAAVGPMAAVAGAIAEYVGRDLLRQSSQVIVENGGDIFIKTHLARKIGVFAGESAYTGKLAFEISPGDTRGICTSSATVGPSLSLGRTDAAVVVCESAILADAWATRLGNMVKSVEDIDLVLEFVKTKPEIKGVLIIVGDKLGVWGEIKLQKGGNNV